MVASTEGGTEARVNVGSLEEDRNKKETRNFGLPYKSFLNGAH